MYDVRRIYEGIKGRFMKKSLWISLLAGVVAAVLVGCGAKKSQANYDFKSKVLSSNYDGTYVIRTQVRAKNAVIAFQDGQRKVVQEVIFDGIEAGSNSVEPLKPLLFDMNARRKYEDYFYKFLSDDGDWKEYVSLADKRTGTTRYKRNSIQSIETLTVTIDRKALKERLVKDGILEK